HFHWKALFYVVLPLAIIDIIIAYFVMKNVTTRRFPKVDIASIVLSTLGFGGLLYGFSSAGNNGWTSPLVIIALVVCAITRTAFMVLSAAEILLPIYMQNMAGYTPLESGLMILPGALVMGVMSPITGRIFDKIGARWLVIIGLSIVTVTTLFFTQLTATTSFIYLTVVFAIRMFGFSMVTMPATTAGLNQLPNHLIPHGTAMNNTMRQVAASIGTAMLITVMTGAALRTGKAADPSDLIRGVNVAFYVTTALTVIALALSFFIKGTTPAEERAAMKAQRNE